MVANGGKATLHVNRRGSDPELALEGVNRDARVGARPVSIVHPRDVAVEQLAPAVIHVHEHREVGFRVDVDNFAVVKGAGVSSRAWLGLKHVQPPQLPGIGAMACAAVGWTADIDAMMDVDCGERRLLAQELEVIVLGLAAPSEVMVGIVSLRACRGVTQCVAQTPEAARTGLPGPTVVVVFRIGVAELEDPVAAGGRRSENRIEQRLVKASSYIEIGIDRQRLDFGASYFVVAGIVADLDINDLEKRLVTAPILAVAIEPAQIVVVRRYWPEHFVPDHLLGGHRIVSVDDRKRLTRDVADQAAVVGGQPGLARVLFGRLGVGLRPVDALGWLDLDRHTVLDAHVRAWWEQVFDLVRVVRSDEIPGFYLGRYRRIGNSDQKHQSSQNSAAPGSPSDCAFHVASLFSASGCRCLEFGPATIP